MSRQDIIDSKMTSPILLSMAVEVRQEFIGDHLARYFEKNLELTKTAKWKEENPHLHMLFAELEHYMDEETSDNEVKEAEQLEREEEEMEFKRNLAMMEDK